MNLVSCHQHDCRTCLLACGGQPGKAPARAARWPAPVLQPLLPRRRLRATAQASNSSQEPTTTVQGEVPPALSRQPLPTKLNNTPHTHEIREFFYQDACNAMVRTVEAGELRMQLRCTIPELNREMDVYRIGTLLELCREMAFCLAQDGRRVKVCVQQALGEGVFQGLPLNLSGVRRIMGAMDWGEIEPFVSFGEVGANQIDDCQYYILIAPQNVVGNTIMTNLEEMVSAAEQQGKTTMLINPVLADIPSAGGVMGVRGRAERMAFGSSFCTAYHFRLLYYSRQAMFPIMGALRYVYGEEWEVYKRVDLATKGEEEYQLIGTCAQQPGSSELTRLFEQSSRPVKDEKRWWR